MFVRTLDFRAIRPFDPWQYGAAAGRRRGGHSHWRRTKRLGAHHRCDAALLRGRPLRGGKQAVAEAWRNLTATSALPRAITDNLNFGIRKSRTSWASLWAVSRGSRRLAARSISRSFPAMCRSTMRAAGARSFPTPAIGGVGLVEDVSRTTTLSFKRSGEKILVLGKTAGWLGQSLYLRDICGREDGAPPPMISRRNGAMAISCGDSSQAGR